MASAPSVKDRILAAGAELVRRLGPARLVQTEVARAARVRQGHLTYYFPTRDDLIVGVARRLLEETAKSGDEQIADRAGPGKLVESLATENRTRALIAVAALACENETVRTELAKEAARFRDELGRAHDGGLPEEDAALAQALSWGFALQKMLAPVTPAVGKRMVARMDDVLAPKKKR